MDIGKFKSSPTRLTLWLLIPPLIAAGVGLSVYALKLQSEWELSRTQSLADALPRLVFVRELAGDLMAEVRGNDQENVKSEDEFISFIQSTAAAGNFTVNRLNVERRTSDSQKLPVLVAKVRGIGTFGAIQKFLGEVAAKQPLLSQSALRVTQSSRSADGSQCNAEATFELVLVDTLDSGGVR
ncbi:MAG: hypothetical protein HKP10_01690 [Kiritimatiellales bacterium]|nr:hypothetical protein [Kiritimatiellales bacterium]